MYYLLKKGFDCINIDNTMDFEKHVESGWTQLTPAEVKAAGMEGYEQYVSPLNTKVDGNGKITFMPPSKEELDAQLAEQIRFERNTKLQETDYLVSGDYPVSAEKLAEIQAYRTALRDITRQEGFPHDVTWPVKPEL